jgi:hypothetical protein
MIEEHSAMHMRQVPHWSTSYLAHCWQQLRAPSLLLLLLLLQISEGGSSC